MVIRYTSTRNGRVNASIAEAIVQGMPQDGGLFVPVQIPALPPEVLNEPGLSYAELAWLVLAPWFDWSEYELRPLIERAYIAQNAPGGEALFDVPEIVPLRAAGSLGNHPLFLLELFHGKTCAFKDLALSLLGRLLQKSLEKCDIDKPLLILTATSGDTGSAALAGLGGQPGIRIAVIYPAEGTSEIQQLQMTSVPVEGRLVVGLRGNFDDAQRAVKRIFQIAGNPDSPFHAIRLSSANSINIGRLLPQIVYYVKAWRELYFSRFLRQGEPFDVVVPSGNFGDILAARYAKAMGLPIGKLVCASNSNRILHDFFSTGVYDRRREFTKTLSPSMDILVSSNLERLLYHALEENPELVAMTMQKFERKGVFELSEKNRATIADFRASWADDAQTLETIRSMWESHGLLVDPHTAVACKVARDVYTKGTEVSGETTDSAPIVVAATASPFKFPAACLEALQGKKGPTSEKGKDLQLAFELSRLTGLPVPKPIAALVSAKINHSTIIDESDLERVLTEFAQQEAGIARIL
ncbi:MAG: threonine synthase [Spirochaetia bacterium]|nr:threonine synthase [Spirochaetia bacterium]